MKIFILLFFISFKTFALDAVVTVLETPMLQDNNYDAFVVQYLRKGDVIKIDPALANTDKYDELGKNFNPMDEEFVATLDRQGHKVYVIKRHLYIYYETQKEFLQTTKKKDETDYRLEEPLPKKYPLYSPSGYRGQFLMGLTQPNYESYHYDSVIKGKGYQSPLDFNLTFMRQAPDDKYDRFFIGGTFNVRTFSNTYSLLNGRYSEEKGTKLGIGPYIAYDAYKGEKNRLNVYGSINVNLFNQLSITQTDQSSQSDNRIYRGISIAPRMGIQYHRKDIVEDIDFILGTSMEIEPPTTFTAKNAANHETWWRHGGSDKFNTRATFTLAGYLGIQSAY
jgi:hypothetical protein